ncbi:MAG: 50S ribosomal protein L25 [Candidatus Nomurabacteria bacterium GW2011_GWF2_35_66]|uniref:Large ribosomal subunit protein bL25 n=1 Tax=Candidatus Nomurabacteria bacterium GW2011_GWE1_35_16 TaxID=1618761 RepID=A0A0G0BB06_9BACT|nr:MAG: 50S ribosomal protein L25 [Candidatus Nomurabacteria bacterium GW2011_GWF1_34_20]KKP63396.1 MAG: 50S ribosomal protein L25 [Candidatus Nomurabacteria bacterium GW2011_GWE2_34_25]KKP66588.1 MAG: 50S ribosomal protein L25 [Candidatus Nomurabacteria bacterium GW2011_GWE1_35_16]KKP83634.1 MAG: 50S ribosomal protein L25 [Candidatus Nomurabacteria bacterium GW2011_GWF2_35_66]HAE36893.1 50S ribosomal protein L25 [Candidatus Nomurabacteria bacterium]
MASMNTLTATKRSKTEKLSVIRNNGMIPAVVYGAQVENQLVSVLSTDFVKTLRIAGETSTIVLDIAGTTEKEKAVKVDVLIHEVQVDPVKGFPIHVDFLAVDMNKPVEVAIPLIFIGIAKAEKDGLGTLVKVLHEIEIEALPKDLPHNIEIDVTIIATLEDLIHVKDIKLPKGVTLVTDGEEVVALVAAAKEEKEEEVVVDLSAIEVEKKGKKEEEAPESTEAK